MNNSPIFVGNNILQLKIISKKDPQLAVNMANHYSHPRGFVGRSICYSIYYDDILYGHIVGGSATLHLAGRDEYFDLNKDNKQEKLKQIVNNIFYHVEPIGGQYPTHNFTIKVLDLFRHTVAVDWTSKYKDEVIGFESLIELPRTGYIYERDHWDKVGITKGYTCKRVAGQGTDSWTGKRVWNTTELKPKWVFCKKV